MRRRLVCAGIVGFLGLGVVTPARAATQVRERDHESVVVLGVPVLNLEGSSTQTCDHNPVEPLLCAVLLAITPLHVHLGSGDTNVLFTLDGSREPAQPAPTDPGGEIIIPLPTP